MQLNQQTTTWHRSALVVSIVVFLALTLTSSPSISSIPTLKDLEAPTTPPTITPESSPAPSQGSQAQSDYLVTLPYGQTILEVSGRTQVDGLLIAAVVEMESGFASNAVSPRGAVGLMQVRPRGAGSPSRQDLTDPETNLEIGSRYLASLLNRYDGDLERALAAYNAGPGVVDRFRGVPPYRETRAYVRRVQERYLGLHQRLWHGGDSETPRHSELAESLGTDAAAVTSLAAATVVAR